MDGGRPSEASPHKPSRPATDVFFPRTDAWRKALRAALESPFQPRAAREPHAAGISLDEASQLSKWVAKLQGAESSASIIGIDDLYRRVAEAAHEGIWLVDKRGDTVFVNAALAELLGYHEQDMLGRSYLGFIPPYARERAEELLIHPTGDVRPRMRADLLRCDGGIVHMMASTTPIHDESGHFFGMLALLTDISELKRTQESMLEAHQSLEHKVGERTKALKQEVERREEAMRALSESEQRYRLIAEYSLDVISSHTPDGIYEYVSPACKQLLGYEQEELIGRHPFEIVHPDDLARVQRVQEELLEHRELLTSECRVRHKDGRWIWFESKARAVVDPKSGQVSSVILNSRDITDRKGVERELRQVKAQLETRIQERTEALTRSMLALRMGKMEKRETEKQLLLLTRAIASAGQGIIVTDPDPGVNKIIYANPAFYHITGYDPEEVIGKNCRFLQGPETSHEMRQAIRDAIAGGRPYSGELINYRKDGSKFWNFLRINPILDEKGEITQFVGVLTDVTESRELEDRLQQTRKMESLGTLAGGVAHDFNNMLTPIMGYAEMLLQSQALSSTHHDWIASMAKTAKRSRELISQILAFARQKPQERKSIDLRALTEDALSIIRAAAPARVKIAFDAPEEVALVSADPTQLHQAIINLCTNAVYVLQQDGGKLELSLERTLVGPGSEARWGRKLAPGEYLSLRVRDDGPGIPADVMPKIWDPFFTTKPGEEGTGMGLPEVLGTVTAHEGSVTVDSRQGWGTAFTVLLPRAQTGVAEPAPESHDQSSDPQRGGGQAVLLVEDEEYVLEVMADMLESLGYQVLAATSASAAHTLYKEAKTEIALILSDHSLPDATGLELLKEFVELGSSHPLVLYTGNPTPAIMEQAKRQGITDVLGKPVDLRVLATTLAGALNAE